MSKKYRSGFERAAKFWPDSETRYQNALIAVRENFTGFGTRDGYRKGKTLSDSQKRQIRRYYNLLHEYIEGGPVYKMSPSELPKKIKKGGRRNVEAVMKAAQMPYGRKRAKFIFVKYDGETIPRVDVRNGSPVFVNDRMGYQKEIIELNKHALAQDVDATIFSIEPLVKGARFFRIVNGRHEFFNAADLATLARKINELQQKYVLGSADSWDRWLYGVAAFYSNSMNAKDIILHERRSKESFKKRVKRENAKIKRKRK